MSTNLTHEEAFGTLKAEPSLDVDLKKLRREMGVKPPMPHILKVLQENECRPGRLLRTHSGLFLEVVQFRKVVDLIAVQ